MGADEAACWQRMGRPALEELLELLLNGPHVPREIKETIMLHGYHYLPLRAARRKEEL